MVNIRGLIRAGVVIFVAGGCLWGCVDKKSADNVPQKVTQEKPMKDPAAIETKAKPVPVSDPCEVFRPPWGEGSWVKWGQENPEAGEEWYDTVEENMKKADLSMIPKCGNLSAMFLGFSELKDLSAVADLKNLKRLDLRMMPQIKDLSPLKDLKNLEYLNITGTGVDDLSPLVELKNLKELEARLLTAKDVKPLAQLPNLVSVDMLKCPVQDVTALAEAPKLEKALLCNTDVADIKPLHKIADRLTALDICDTKFRDFDDLKPFKKLTFLRLWGLPIKDLSPLEGMTELDDLDLSKTSVDDLSVLHDMKKLTVLRLLMVDIDPAQVQALKKAVPGVEVLQKVQAQ